MQEVQAKTAIAILDNAAIPIVCGAMSFPCIGKGWDVKLKALSEK
jgi:hypothetical protein